jgi:hypothetical protein
MVAFTPDGRALVSASEDTTVMIWDVADARAAARTPLAGPPPQGWDALWEDMADTVDATKARRAIFELTRRGDAAVIVLGERLHPAKAADDTAVRRWLADLDSERYAARERADAELRKLGESAAPALRRALATATSKEFRFRAERLLKRFADPASDADALRQVRALAVLETVGTPAAQRVLQALAGGETEARLTREAQAALGRR